jgi:type II secretory pathway pseudopilin PulG
MRKGFTYLNLLVYTALFLILFGAVAAVFYPLLQKNFKTLNELKTNQELNRVIDTIAADIGFADKVGVAGNSFIYETNSITYEYLLKNKRIDIKKDGYVYLTSKEINIEQFQPQKIKTDIYLLTVSSGKYRIERYIALRN